MSPKGAFASSFFVLPPAAGRATFLRAGGLTVGGLAVGGILVHELVVNGAASEMLIKHKAATPAANVWRKRANPPGVRETAAEPVKVVTLVSPKRKLSLTCPKHRRRFSHILE